MASKAVARGRALLRKLRNDEKVKDPEKLAGWIASRKRGGWGSGGSSGKSSGSSSGSTGGSSKGRKISAGSLADRVRSGSSPKKAERPSVLAKKPDLTDDDPFNEDYGPEEEKTKEQKAQERMEQALIRKMEREDRSKVYNAVMEFGGIRPTAGLKEEYQAVPNTFKRKDGFGGDDVAAFLASSYPELGIESENDLIQYLAA